MAEHIEIVVKTEVLMAESFSLKKIAREVNNKKITRTLHSSKGDTAASINNLIQDLNNMGTELAKLMNENSENVKKIAEQFIDTDQKIARSKAGSSGGGFR